jgi:hypothetical protein
MAKHQKVEKEKTFDVTVWNTLDGDIVKKLWSATSAEVAEIEEQFSDEPNCTVQVEEI